MSTRRNQNRERHHPRYCGTCGSTPPGKVLHVEVEQLEFRDDPPEEEGVKFGSVEIVAPITVGGLDGFIMSPKRDREKDVDPAEYALLAWVESGHGVFQPAEPTEAERQAFQRTAARLLDLRERGLIQVAAAHISRSGSGHYLRIGPCVLSTEGRTALVNVWLDAPAPWLSQKRPSGD